MATYRISIAGLLLSVSCSLWAADNAFDTSSPFQASAGAQFMLAQMTHDGHKSTGSGPPDDTYVYEDLKSKAESGDAFAQYSFAQLLASGRGGPIADYPGAYLWLSLAVKGLPPGTKQQEAGVMLERIEKWLNPQQLADTRKQVESWKPAKEPGDGVNRKNPERHDGMTH